LPHLLFSLVVTTPASDVNLAAAYQALSALTERAIRSQEDAAEIVSLARDLHLLITRQVIVVGPEHKVVDPEEFRCGHLLRKYRRAQRRTPPPCRQLSPRSSRQS